MDEIKQKAQALQDSWAVVFGQAKAAESAWRPHLPYSSLEEIGEVIQTLHNLLDRVRAPSGFSPGFHLAKGLAAPTFASIITLSKNLEGGQYNHFPTFVSTLVTLMNALHTMTIFSAQDPLQESAGGVAVQLSQGIALINTAQHELSMKKDLLEKLDVVVEKIGSHAEEVLAISEKVAVDLQVVEQTRDSAMSKGNEIEKLAVEIQETRESMKEQNGISMANMAKTTEVQKGAEAINQKCQEQQALIDSLLPKGASAGLAAAFAQRESQLGVSKMLWAVTFFVSIAGLVAFAVYLTGISQGSVGDFWKSISVRLPLAAPMVWLGWFAAVQYGNIVRVQEDYAFKEATSKAFAGYRDHLTHLASIDAGDAKSAMQYMAEKTIDILAREPLRIFNKTDKDVSPIQSLVSGLRRAESKNKAGDS